MMPVPNSRIAAQHGTQAMTNKTQVQKEANERVLASDKTVAKMIDGSRAIVWRRVKDHTLPQPIKVGGLTRWPLPELKALLYLMMRLWSQRLTVSGRLKDGYR